MFDAIMAAINTKELTSAKLGRMLSRSLNVSQRKIKRGRAIRKEMEDMDKKNWIRRSLREMEERNVPDSDIKKYLDENPSKVQCQLCNTDCHPGKKYQTFSVSPLSCANALLCDKVKKI